MLQLYILSQDLIVPSNFERMLHACVLSPPIAAMFVLPSTTVTPKLLKAK